MTISAALTGSDGPVSSIKTTLLYTNVARVVAARPGQIAVELTTGKVVTTSFAQCFWGHLSTVAVGLTEGVKVVGVDVGFKVVGVDVGFNVVGVDVGFKVVGLDVGASVVGFDDVGLDV